MTQEPLTTEKLRELRERFSRGSVSSAVPIIPQTEPTGPLQRPADGREIILQPERPGTPIIAPQEEDDDRSFLERMENLAFKLTTGSSGEFTFTRGLVSGLKVAGKNFGIRAIPGIGPGGLVRDQDAVERAISRNTSSFEPESATEALGFMFGSEVIGGIFGGGSTIETGNIDPITSVALAVPPATPIAVGLASSFGAARARIGSLPPASQIVHDLAPADDLWRAISQSNFFRTFGERLNSVPGVKPITKRVFGKAADLRPVENRVAAMNGAMSAQVEQQSALVEAEWQRFGTVKGIFREADDGFNVVLDDGTRTSIGEIVDNFPKFRSKLNPTQEGHLLAKVQASDEGSSLLRSHGIEIGQFVPEEEGALFLSRRVAGRLTDNGELIESAVVGPTGGKGAFQKARTFKTTREALDAGFEFLNDDVVQGLRVRSIYRQIARKNLADWVLDEQVPDVWRYANRSDDLQNAVQSLRSAVSRDTNSLQLVLRDLRNVKGPEAKLVRDTLKALVKRKGEIDRIPLGFEDSASFNNIVANMSVRMNELRATTMNVIRALSKNRTARVQQVNQRLLKVQQRLDKRINTLGTADDPNSIAGRWKAQEALTRPGAGEVSLNIQGFRSKTRTVGDKERQTNIIFTDIEIAREIEKGLSQGPVIQALRAVNQVNAVGRLFALGVDYSFLGIQLLFMAGANPLRFGRAARGAYQSFLDPQFIPNYYAMHSGTIRQFPNLLLSRSAPLEVTEALGRGGLLTKGPLRPIGRGAEPFKRAFDAAMDVAGVEMAEAFAYRANTPEAAEQIGAFINNFRGMTDRGRLGISAFQRDIESLTLLAPRYNAAMAAIVGDLFQGGLRGSLARRSMVKATGSMTAVAYAFSRSRGESHEEAMRHLTPVVKDPRSGEFRNNSEFMTWNISGQAIGPGTKIRSFINLAASMATNPSDIRSITIENWMDNPGLRFLRANLAPVPGAVGDIINGRNFIGDPTTTWEGFLKNVIGQRFLPLLVQSLALEGGTAQERLTRGAFEMFGFRNYPLPPIAAFTNHAEEQYMNIDTPEKPIGVRVRYEDMPLKWRAFYQRVDQKGVGLWNEYLRDSEKRGRADELLRRNRSARDNRLEQLRDSIDAKLRAGVGFRFIRDDYGDYGGDLRAAFTEIQNDLPDTFRELNERPPSHLPEDFAFEQYMNIINDPALDNDVLGYNHAELDRRVESLRNQIGEDLWNYIQEVRSIQRADLPQVIQELIADRERLRPYWNIADDIMEREGLTEDFQRYATLSGQEQRAFLLDRIDLRLALREVDRERRLRRFDDPDIDALLLKWDYVSAPLAPENRVLQVN